VLNGFPKHSVETIKIFLVLLGVSFSFWGIEYFCSLVGAPTYIVLIAHLIAIALIVTDAIVLLAVVILWAVKTVVVKCIRVYKDIKKAAKNDK
jgi:ABC-type transport system involved in cytochrome c biogenesis permease component